MICLNDQHCSKGDPKFCFISDFLLLAKSTLAYVVGHFHISRKIVIEHLAFAAGEARDGFCQVAFDHKNGKIAAAAYEWIIRHFSRAGDYVVDLFSKNASAVIASIKNSRHGIYFGRMEDQETIRCELASQVQPRNKARDLE